MGLSAEDDLRTTVQVGVKPIRPFEATERLVDKWPAPVPRWFDLSARVGKSRVVTRLLPRRCLLVASGQFAAKGPAIGPGSWLFQTLMRVLPTFRDYARRSVAIPNNGHPLPPLLKPPPGCRKSFKKSGRLPWGSLFPV